MRILSLILLFVAPCICYAQSTPRAKAAYSLIFSQKEKKAPEQAPAPHSVRRECVEPVVGMRYQHPDNGKWYTYKEDGYWHSDVDVAPVNPTPIYEQPIYQQPVYQQQRSFRYFGGGGSGCST